MCGRVPLITYTVAGWLQITTAVMPRPLPSMRVLIVRDILPGANCRARAATLSARRRKLRSTRPPGARSILSNLDLLIVTCALTATPLPDTGRTLAARR